jgi:hypothetical protein
MMARSVRRNRTALSGRWKLGGEANRRKEEKNGRQKLEQGRLDRADESREEGRGKKDKRGCEIASRVMTEIVSMFEL